MRKFNVYVADICKVAMVSLDAGMIFCRGGTFVFSFSISQVYPHEAPKVKCKTKVRELFKRRKPLCLPCLARYLGTAPSFHLLKVNRVTDQGNGSFIKSVRFWKSLS
jgi:hypothetical protein